MSDKTALDVDTPSLSFKLTHSGINPSHKHTLWPRALFPCYDSLREGFQPIQGWSDLSHFPRLVQAIDSTQRRRPLLVPPLQPASPALNFPRHIAPSPPECRWGFEVVVRSEKRKRQTVLSVKGPSNTHQRTTAPEKICLQLSNVLSRMSPCGVDRIR